MCLKIITSSLFEYFILAVIITNSVILAFDDPTDDQSDMPAGVDTFFLVVYTVEMGLKIFGLGFVLEKKSYLRDFWNVMDFVIVVTAYVPIIFASNGVNLQSFRSLRVLRPLRTISNIEALRVIVITLLSALGPLLDTLFILFFLFSIFSIAGLQLFSGLLKKRCIALETGIVMADISENITNGERLCNTDSDCTSSDGVWYICGKMNQNPDYNFTNFDTILFALLMVFQTVTLEGWSDIMLGLQKTFSPLIAIYFVVLIVIGSFFLLNLTLAVIKAEFTSQAHHIKEEDDEPKNWSYERKLNAKIEYHKADIFKLIRKRKNEEIRFNKYEIKNEGMVAIEDEKLHRSSIKLMRRKTRKPVSKFRMKLEKMVDYIRDCRIQHILRKFARSLMNIIIRIRLILPFFPKKTEKAAKTAKVADSRSKSCFNFD